MSAFVAHGRDQCHRAPAESFSRVVARLADRPVLGLTGTPWRNDDADPILYGLIGPLAFRISARELIRRGYLAEPYFIEVMPIFKVDDENIIKKYRELEAEIEKLKGSSESRAKILAEISKLRGRQTTLLRNWLGATPQKIKFIAELAVMAPKPAIVFLDRIKGVDMMVDMLKKRGLSVAKVTGELKGQERLEIFRKAKAGQLDVVVMTKAGDEGVDIPNVRTVIIGIMEKSKVNLPQRVGRALRVEGGKDKALIIDVQEIPEIGEDKWEDKRIQKRFVENAEERIEVVRRALDNAVKVFRVGPYSPNMALDRVWRIIENVFCASACEPL